MWRRKKISNFCLRKWFLLVLAQKDVLWGVTLHALYDYCYESPSTDMYVRERMSFQYSPPYRIIITVVIIVVVVLPKVWNEKWENIHHELLLFVATTSEAKKHFFPRENFSFVRFFTFNSSPYLSPSLSFNAIVCSMVNELLEESFSNKNVNRTTYNNVRRATSRVWFHGHSNILCDTNW